VTGGIDANPAFIDGFAGALIACIAGDAHTILGAVIKRRMHEEHAEGDKITGRKFSGHPAAPKFITQRRWVVREGATEGPFAGPRGFGFRRLVGAKSINVTVNIFLQQICALVGALF